LRVYISHFRVFFLIIDLVIMKKKSQLSLKKYSVAFVSLVAIALNWLTYQLNQWSEHTNMYLVVYW